MDGESREPLKGVRFTLRGGGERQHSWLTDEKGMITFENVAPGYWRLESGGSRGAIHRSLFLSPGADVDLGTLELHSPRQIVFRLPEDVDQVSILLCPEEQSGWPTALSSIPIEVRHRRGEGLVALEGIAPGRYVGVVSCELGLPRQAMLVDVGERGAELSVSAVAGARLCLAATYPETESRFLMIEGSSGLPVHSVYLRGGEPSHLYLASGSYTLRVLEAGSGRQLDAKGLWVGSEDALVEVQ